MVVYFPFKPPCKIVVTSRSRRSNVEKKRQLATDKLIAKINKDNVIEPRERDVRRTCVKCDSTGTLMSLPPYFRVKICSELLCPFQLLS
jgi:hypothetical protein